MIVLQLCVAAAITWPPPDGAARQLWQVRPERLTFAARTRANSPATPELTPPAPLRIAVARAGAAPPQGSAWPLRPADRRASAAGYQRGASRCRTAGRQACSRYLRRA